MGYQVGRICYQTYEDAANVLMTQVLPTIDKDGVLHHPVFNGKDWVYKEQVIKLTYPQCEYGAYAKAGKEVGLGMVSAIAVLLVVVVALRSVALIESESNEK